MDVKTAARKIKTLEKKYKNYTRADYARMYDKMGMILLTLDENQKTPNGGYKNNTREKNKEVIKNIETKNSNYGILAKEDFYIVDIDLKDNYNKDGELKISEKEAISRWNKILKEIKFPATTTQKSANGKGQHYIFKNTEHIQTIRKQVKEDKEKTTGKEQKTLPNFQTAEIDDFIDIRFMNGYVVGAGSVVNGNEYKIISDVEPQEISNELFDYLYAKYPTNLKTEKKEKKKPPTKEKRVKVEAENGDIEDTNDENKKEIEIIKDILNLIDVKYVDKYQTAISIIWSCASEGKELKQTTHEIMSKSEQWVNEIPVWDYFDDGKGITIGTALNYAKVSKPETFLKKMKKIYSQKLDFENLTDENVANVFVELYGGDYIYKERTIYKWNGVYWEEIDREDIMQTIFDKLYPVFYDVMEKKYTYSMNEDKESQERKANKKSKAIKFINKKMADSRGAEKVANVIKIKLRKNTIEEELNNNWNLFLFKNCVYDLQEQKFIEPKREHYMTMTTGYKYIEPKQKHIDTINKFLNSIIEDEEERNFYLKLLSCGLEGRMTQKFIMANGEGGNGKSILHNCIYEMMGEYGHEITNNIFQSGKNKDSQSLANLHLKRFVKASEPDKDCGLDTGMTKALTGGDNFQARRMYSKEDKNINHGTYFLECNSRPKFNEADDALERRLIDFKFKNIFKEDIENYKDVANVKPANKYYDSNEFKKDMKCAWFYVIKEAHKQYLNDDFNLRIPKSVKERTHKYLENCGDINAWINENIKGTRDENDLITIKELYEKFKEVKFSRT